MTLDPNNNPAVKRLTEQYEEQAAELESALAAVKGAKYARQVRFMANMQSTVGKLAEFMCSGIPPMMQMAVTMAAATNLSDLCNEFADDNPIAAKEFVTNVMNLIAARDKLELEVNELLNKDSSD